MPWLAQAFEIATRRPGRAGVLLSFDDGPHVEGTPAILAELERAGAKRALLRLLVSRSSAIRRSFGMSSQQATSWGCTAIAIRPGASGRVGCSSTIRHVQSTPSAVRRARLHSCTGHRTESSACPAYVPSGSSASSRCCGPNGVETGRSARTASSVARSATSQIAAGDVILLHDADHYGARGSWRVTAAALPLVFAALERAGLDTVPAGEHGGRFALSRSVWLRLTLYQREWGHRRGPTLTQAPRRESVSLDLRVRRTVAPRSRLR